MKFSTLSTFACIATSAFVSAAPVNEGLKDAVIFTKKDMDVLSSLDADTVRVLVRELKDGADETSLAKRFELSDNEKEILEKVYNFLKKYVTKWVDGHFGGSSSADGSAPTLSAAGAPPAESASPSADAGSILGQLTGLGGATDTATTAPTKAPGAGGESAAAPQPSAATTAGGAQGAPGATQAPTTSGKGSSGLGILGGLLGSN